MKTPYNITMKRTSEKFVSMKKYNLPDISMAAIRKYAHQVAERFKPEKIILFGSFAYGEPNEHSDVDLLVVMPCPNESTQAVRIRVALKAPFAMDLIVRTPDRLRERIELEDWFLREITEKGIVLYEQAHHGMDQESRSRHPKRKNADRRKPSTA